MIIKLKQENNDYPDLAFGRLYFVIGIESDDYRILNNHGIPYLYPSSIFVITDNNEPHEWVTEYGEEGERYSYPPILNSVGFFEDFFDRKEKAVSTFWNVINQHLSHVA